MFKKLNQSLKWVAHHEHKQIFMISYGAMLFEGLLNVIIVALIPFLAERYHVEVGQIGLLLTAKSLGTFCMLYISGYVSDRFGRRTVLVLGGAFLMIFVAGLMLAPNLIWGIAFAFIGGLGHGLMDTPAISVLFDVFNENAGPAMSLVQVSFSGGSFLCTIILAGLLYVGLSWSWLVYLCLLIGLGLVYLSLTAQFPESSSQTITEVEDIIEVENEVEDRLHLPIEPTTKLTDGISLGLTMLFASSFAALMIAWLATYSNEVKGVTVANSLLLITAYQLGSVLGSLFFAYVLRVMHVSKLMVINAMGALIVFAGILFFDSYAILMALAFLCGVCIPCYYSFTINMGGELFPKNTGAATGALATISMFAYSLINYVSTRLIEQWGIEKVFNKGWLLLIILIVSTILCYQHYQKLSKRRGVSS